MNELPSVIVFQVLSLLEPCYERQFAHLLDACFKSLNHCSTDALTLTRYLKRLAGTSAVQTFIYQSVVLTKIYRLTLKRFEEK